MKFQNQNISYANLKIFNGDDTNNTFGVELLHR